VIKISTTGNATKFIACHITQCTKKEVTSLQTLSPKYIINHEETSDMPKWTCCKQKSLKNCEVHDRGAVSD
jgi:hypothetical protein